jgi:hypothetical protein
MGSFRAILLLLALLLGACSMRSAIDALSSPEDRAFAQDFVAKMRRGDVKSLEPVFDPGVWRESEPQFAGAPRLYPPTEGTTELIGYQFNTSSTNGVTTRVKNYTLVTHDASHWTTTVIQTRSDRNGPDRIVGWNVNGGPEMPPLYRQYQSVEAAIPWIRGGAIVALLAAIGLIVWLVRRSRRKRAARQGVGTP